MDALGTRRQGTWRRWFSVVFLAAFVASALSGGFSFVICLGMQQAKLSCCCPAPQVDDEAALRRGDPGPSVDRECCESHRFDSAAHYRAAADPSPAVAPPAVAVLLEPAQGPVLAARASFVAPAERPVPVGRGPPRIAVFQRTQRILC